MVSPAKANIGMTLSFTVTGSNLVDGMKFSLPDCANIVEVSGGSSTQRQFSCTPGGLSGNRQGGIYANANATSPLLSVTVEYQAIAAFVSTLGANYAVLKSDGTLWVWNSQKTKPTKEGDDFVDVAVGTYDFLAIKKDGTLWSWGLANNSGLQGNGTTGANATPKQIGTDFLKVVVKGENTTGGESAEGLKKDGSVWVWGARSLAQPNAAGTELAPRMIATGFVDIARGSAGSSLGIKSDGSLWTWNRNLSDRPFVPVKVADGYTSIAVSYDATFGIKADHSLWNWERNSPNQGTTGIPTASSPIKVGDGLLSVSTGFGYALALKSDGTLWAGGDGLNGQFGEGKATGGPFRQIGTGVVGAWAGSSCSFMKKSDGTLWATGYCNLGDGKFTRYIYTFEQVTL